MKERLPSPVAQTDPEFYGITQNFITRDIGAYCALDGKLRALLVLAAAVTLDCPHEIVRQTDAALNANATPAAVKETVYHCAPYAGICRAETALSTVNAVFAQHRLPPVESQATVTQKSRQERGYAVQKSILDRASTTCAPQRPRGKRTYRNICRHTASAIFTRAAHWTLRSAS